MLKTCRAGLLAWGSLPLSAQRGWRYRVDLALSARSRRVCERTDRGLWLDVWAPNPNPDVTEPAAVIERHCGGRAVFTVAVARA